MCGLQAMLNEQFRDGGEAGASLLFQNSQLLEQLDHEANLKSQLQLELHKAEGQNSCCCTLYYFLCIRHLCFLIFCSVCIYMCGSRSDGRICSWESSFGGGTSAEGNAAAASGRGTGEHTYQTAEAQWKSCPPPASERSPHGQPRRHWEGWERKGLGPWFKLTCFSLILKLNYITCN